MKTKSLQNNLLKLWDSIQEIENAMEDIPNELWNRISIELAHPLSRVFGESVEKKTKAYGFKIQTR